MPENRECNAARDDLTEVPAPDLPYLPRDPKAYAPGIGVIGCGGIVPYHLGAYQRAGYRVAMLCDVDVSRAEALRNEFYPDAAVCADYGAILDDDEIEVVDVATHPEVRVGILEDAIRARKHVLSQKPFVTNLTVGRRLVDLAAEHGVKLAVNQNGRWAPHFSYLRHAVAAGLVGEVMAVHCAVHWNHDWTADTPFNEVEHLILYDFGIHWFDIVSCLLTDKPPRSVYATTSRAPGQRAKPPMLAQVAVQCDNAQASLVFDAFTNHGEEDRTVIVGTTGTLVSAGPDLNHQAVTLYTEAGYAVPALEGTWFTNGFHGTMAELLCAIEDDREPSNSAAGNLASLALCFAAVASSIEGLPKAPGRILNLPGTEE